MRGEIYNGNGPECPHCSHVQKVSDDPSIYYDEDLTEVECSNCERTYRCRLHVRHSWSSQPLKASGE